MQLERSVHRSLSACMDGRKCRSTGTQKADGVAVQIFFPLAWYRRIYLFSWFPSLSTRSLIFEPISFFTVRFSFSFSVI